MVYRSFSPRLSSTPAEKHHLASPKGECFSVHDDNSDSTVSKIRRISKCGEGEVIHQAELEMLTRQQQSPHTGPTRGIGAGSHGAARSRRRGRDRGPHRLEIREMGARCPDPQIEGQVTSSANSGNEMQPDRLSNRINNLPKWARDYCRMARSSCTCTYASRQTDPVAD